MICTHYFNNESESKPRKFIHHNYIQMQDVSIIRMRLYTVASKMKKKNHKQGEKNSKQRVLVQLRN